MAQPTSEQQPSLIPDPDQQVPTPMPPPAPADNDAPDEGGWEADSGSVMTVPGRDPTPRLSAQDIADQVARDGGHAPPAPAAPAPAAPPAPLAPPAPAEAAGETPAHPRVTTLRQQIAEQVHRREEVKREIAELERTREAAQTLQQTQPPAPTPAAPTDPAAAPVEDPEPTLEQHGGDWEKFDRERHSWVKRQMQAAGQARGASQEQIDQAVERRLGEERVQRRVVEAQQTFGREMNGLMQADSTLTERLNATFSDSEGKSLESQLLRDVFWFTQDGAKFMADLTQAPDEVAVLASLEATEPVRQAILSSKTPHQLMRHFARAPHEFEGLKAMHPTLMMREVGSLEARLTAAPPVASAAVAQPAATVPAGPQVPPVARPLSTAPAPLSPPRGTPTGRVAPGSSLDTVPGDDGFEDFVSLGNAEEFERKKRGF